MPFSKMYRSNNASLYFEKAGRIKSSGFFVETVIAPYHISQLTVIAIISTDSIEKSKVLQQYSGSAHVGTCSPFLPLRKIVMPLTPSR
jgi:hypothetical protein